MRWLRVWSHLLLPLFLSLALIQLFISDHKSTKTLQLWNRQLEAKHVEMGEWPVTPGGVLWRCPTGFSVGASSIVHFNTGRVVVVGGGGETFFLKGSLCCEGI